MPRVFTAPPAAGPTLWQASAVGIRQRSSIRQHGGRAVELSIPDRPSSAEWMRSADARRTPACRSWATVLEGSVVAISLTVGDGVVGKAIHQHPLAPLESLGPSGPIGPVHDI